ncbi:MAG: universal stress protein [Devosia sp.]|uniref:universal stress protein n=1 Tax=Devosia sp. TaxID=1871048 RepID=UPI0024CAA7CD|nr:universal stress protein [Devosia sp.]UYN98604.1 MAG: universal stress protein [Devosia sp.]
MFKTILVPFDGSKGAEGGLDKAIEIARHGDAQLLVLTVFRHHSMLEASFSMVRPADPENMDDIMRDHAKTVADHAKNRAREAGVADVRAFVKPGQPARTIVSFAREKKADLIVVGSRGAGSVEGFLLGSVSHKVTSLAQCPVLVV